MRPPPRLAALTGAGRAAKVPASGIAGTRDEGLGGHGWRHRLTLQTDYWIQTPIDAYSAWWGDIFLNDFHGIVLGVIKERSERAVAACRR